MGVYLYNLLDDKQVGKIVNIGPKVLIRSPRKEEYYCRPQEIPNSV